MSRNNVTWNDDKGLGQSAHQVATLFFKGHLNGKVNMLGLD